MRNTCTKDHLNDPELCSLCCIFCQFRFHVIAISPCRYVVSSSSRTLEYGNGQSQLSPFAQTSPTLNNQVHVIMLLMSNAPHKAPNTLDPSYSQRDDEDQKDSVIDPGPNDVLCDRHPKAYGHEGNHAFRVLCEKRAVPEYAIHMTNNNKSEKGKLVESIIDIIHSSGGRFLKKTRKQSTWRVATKLQAREKVGIELRKAVHLHKKSKKEAPQSVQRYAAKRSVDDIDDPQGASLSDKRAAISNSDDVIFSTDTVLVGKTQKAAIKRRDASARRALLSGTRTGNGVAEPTKPTDELSKAARKAVLYSQQKEPWSAEAQPLAAMESRTDLIAKQHPDAILADELNAFLAASAILDASQNATSALDSSSSQASKSDTQSGRPPMNQSDSAKRGVPLSFGQVEFTEEKSLSSAHDPQEQQELSHFSSSSEEIISDELLSSVLDGRSNDKGSPDS